MSQVHIWVGLLKRGEGVGLSDQMCRWREGGREGGMGEERGEGGEGMVEGEERGLSELK